MGNRSRIIPLLAVVAVISGAVGYFAGLASRRGGQSATTMPIAAQHPAERAKVEPAPQRPDRPRGGDWRGLRERLDAEASPIARFRMAMGEMEGWVAAQPLEALSWLTAQEPSSYRAEVIRRALLQFAENDPAGAADWALKNLTGNELDNTLIRISDHWVERDARGAAEWFAALPQGSGRNGALENLFFVWGTQDPSAAANYLTEGKAGDLSPVLAQALYAGWAKVDPRGAAGASLESSQRDGDPARFANTVANWATIDPEAAGIWLIERVSDPSLRGPAVAEVAGMFAHQSPAAGLAWIERLAPQERQAATDRLVEQWGDSDAVSAAAWLAKAPARMPGPEVVDAVLQGFLGNDADAYLRWRDALPPGSLKDRAAKVGVVAEEN